MGIQIFLIAYEVNEKLSNFHSENYAKTGQSPTQIQQYDPLEYQRNRYAIACAKEHTKQKEF